MIEFIEDFIAPNDDLNGAELVDSKRTIKHSSEQVERLINTWSEIPSLKNIPQSCFDNISVRFAFDQLKSVSANISRVISKESINEEQYTANESNMVNMCDNDIDEPQFDKLNEN